MVPGNKEIENKQPRVQAPSKRLIQAGFFVCALLVFFIFFEFVNEDCPTDPQLRIFHIMLAAGVGGLAASFTGFLDVKHPVGAMAGGGFAAFLVVYLCQPAQLTTDTRGCAPFSLTTHVKNQAREGEVVGQKATLVVGRHHFGPETVNEKGDLTFYNIPQEYADDSVTLDFANRRLVTVAQNAYSPREAREITFTVRFIPDTTVVRGQVFRLDGRRVRPVAGAIVTYDHEFKAITDTAGNYKIPIPRSEGTLCSVQIHYRGEEVEYRNNMVITANAMFNYRID